MRLEPLINTTLAIQIHTAAAILAFFLGGLVLFRRKGDRLHRIGGHIWVGLMLVVAITSFFIHAIQVFGIWSPIHLLSAMTLWFLGLGVWLARRRRTMQHRWVMQGTYVGALVLAGFFTFMPGRIMHQVMFGGPSPMAGTAVLTIVVGGGIYLLFRGMMGLDARADWRQSPHQLRQVAAAYNARTRRRRAKG